MNLYQSPIYTIYCGDGSQVTTRHDRAKDFMCLKGSVIVIEGLIGAGKTSAGHSVVYWLNCNGISARFFAEMRVPALLGQYLKDMKKYAYTFQLCMLMNRIHTYQEAWKYTQSGGVAIIDRSLLGDYTFAKMQKEKGFFTDDEWDTYLAMMKHDPIFDPTAIVYLHCKPSKAFQRMKSRGIQSETTSYTLEYFNDLHYAYEKAMTEISNSIYKLPWEVDVTLIEAETEEKTKYLPQETCIKLLDEIRKNITGD